MNATSNSNHVSQAAEAILALINSSPRTPTQEAIAAIIRDAADPNTSRPGALAQLSQLNGQNHRKA